MFDMNPMDIPEYFQPFVTIATSPLSKCVSDITMTTTFHTFHSLLAYISKSAEQGAQTQEFLAASTKISLNDAGKYFDNSRPISPYANANDDALAQWLWTRSEELTGVSYLS